MKKILKASVRRAVDPLGRGLALLGLSANAVTVIGLLLAVVSAYGFYVGSRSLSFAFLLASGFADLLDGAVARARDARGTPFGAAFDSTLDRYGEGLVLGGILIGMASRGAEPWLLAVALLAGLGSFLVSYVRARAEGLGVACEVGLLERPERLVLLLVLALWGPAGELWILGILALLTHATFLQRLAHVHRVTAARPAEMPRSEDNHERAI